MPKTERNQELYERLRNGDPAARRLLVESNWPLVRHLVREFIDLAPDLLWLRKDLLSDGNLALLETVDSLANRTAAPKNNPTAYLTKAIKNAFKRCRDQSGLIGPKARTTQTKRRKAQLTRRRCLRGEGHCNTVNDCNHTEDCIRYAMRNGNGKRDEDEYIHEDHRACRGAERKRNAG